MNPGHGRCVNDAYIESCGVCDIVLKKKKDQKMTKADKKRCDDKFYEEEKRLSKQA